MKNIKLQIFLIIFLISSLPSLAQLNPGDIMVIGFMGDGDGTPIPTATDPPSANCGDGFSFVALVDVSAGEQVIFTEEEWAPTPAPGGFNNGGEGHVIWTNTTGSIISAGTVIQITTHGQQEVTDGNCGILESTIGGVSFHTTGNWALSSSNEEIYVYQGSPGNPTNWISAFFTDDFNVTSFVPSELNGFVVDLESADPDADIAVYSGGLDCSVPGSCIANITNPANWSTDNGSGFQCCDATGAEYPDDVPVAFEGFCNTPVIVCPPDVTISCESSTDPSATGMATATDGCGAVLVTFADSEATGRCANEKTISRIWTATDDDGNTTTCTQIITIVDQTVPVAPPPPADITVQCANDVPAPVDLTATNNCGEPITVSPTAQITPGNCVNDFTMVRTWIFVDECGNTSSVSQTIIVKDNLAPVAPAAPADITVSCAADVPTPVDLTATDNCNGDITASPTAQITPGSCANDFTMVRTWTFVDECGNISSISQTIIVKDDLAPIAPAAPADLVLQCAADVPAPVDLTATDNCNGDITASPTAQITPGSCANDFTMVRTWIFTDECGNTSSVSQTIIVRDDIAPVAPAAPADLVLENVDDIPSPISLTATDNCNGEITADPAIQITPGACAGDIVEVRTWAFTDDCGNTSSVSQTITVIDREPPVISVLANPLVLWPPNHQYYTVNVTDFVLGVEDDCGLLSISDVIITQVTSDEPEDANGGGDGNTLNDILTGQDCQSVDLRVERDGKGNGRVYTIFTALTDDNGNTAVAEYQVHVPKSFEEDSKHKKKGKKSKKSKKKDKHKKKRKPKPAVDDGAVYIISGCGNENARIAGTTESVIIDNILEEIEIYPNPVVDIITVQLSNEINYRDEIIKVYLYNLTGIDVSENNQRFINSNRLEIDMYELPAGVYLLVIPYEGNYFQRRIIKL